MPRPRKRRRLQYTLEPAVFKPIGVPLKTLDRTLLLREELEALRLADLEGKHQARAAEQMAVSRSTFQRTVSAAHYKVAQALVQGRAIEIEGSVVRVAGVRWHCDACGHNWQLEHGAGAGPPELCPACSGRAIGERRPKRPRR
jgi:uncharacterized protein